MFSESEGDYRDRVRTEGNEAVIKKGTGESPKKSLFEGTDKYKRRIKKEANEATILINGKAAAMAVFRERKRVPDIGLKTRRMRLVIGV